MNFSVSCQGDVALCWNRDFIFILSSFEFFACEKIIEHDVLISYAWLSICSTEYSKQSHVRNWVSFPFILSILNHLLYHMANHFRRYVFLQKPFSILQKLNNQIIDKLFFSFFQNLLNVRLY